MAYTPLEKIWTTVENRYFAVIVAAKEARRINRAPKEEEKGEKPTLIALSRLIDKDISYAAEES